MVSVILRVHYVSRLLLMFDVGLVCHGGTAEIVYLHIVLNLWHGVLIAYTLTLDAAQATHQMKVADPQG